MLLGVFAVIRNVIIYFYVIYFKESVIYAYQVDFDC